MKDSGGSEMQLKGFHFWLLSALNIIFLLAGQGGGIILGRIYYDNGGNSKWMSTLVQSAGFPVLLIPYFLIPLSKEHSDSSNQPPPPPSMIKVTIIYFLLGALTAGENMLYSVALLYLSASTYSLICATQLAFNAVFSYFINGQKFTALIFNSVITLTLAASLLAINEDSDKPSGVTRWKYMFGIIAAIADSAVYSLILSLMQLSFQKVIKKETFHVVLEMQIFVSLVAACISTIGLFGSGEWRTLSGEMHAFAAGKAGYVQVLVWTCLGWQVCAVGVVGLIFVVSSLFCNVISTLSLAVTPIASVIILHDKMNGVKVIALIMAMWGSGNYIYQNYLDDLKARKTHLASADTATNVEML
ncbi:PREDICTED: probable purine permease 11 isoform X3 [Ipomoea nil]|uniref:probable purine permease 11 isoform X3 n=1 Tax=Ipomoea nil TaxID=35883 RepID=UPI0009018F57|nr:PREDICTED: probable purine permease 11 isoform X3 [Ipomoea nil]XP_019188059.1 PREDICTED: probable purine permease 11 isoform X3 [Ipomoea nil]XP_019188066.1 PREDICTED: probable purine permease 11 isoform X3 [Ipomoea nil]XP_019188074.1 PREDICTED: probable purine permease 11 isoform X3 [Ipomoea nil]XP_019188081.1 PREDICTED: probable purine permease 11 isoform X3 [Ipomoea nil]XP_019188090.1 PREDICTED: probable purine permease 11 isoform X3 [Ipomoea nil]XP_019188098.1 PREDICTED: probable purine